MLICVLVNYPMDGEYFDKLKQSAECINVYFDKSVKTQAFNCLENAHAQNQCEYEPNQLTVRAQEHLFIDSATLFG